jgi:hypothetical protein
MDGGGHICEVAGAVYSGTKLWEARRGSRPEWGGKGQQGKIGNSETIEIKDR